MIKAASVVGNIFSVEVCVTPTHPPQIRRQPVRSHTYFQTVRLLLATTGVECSSFLAPSFLELWRRKFIQQVCADLTSLSQGKLLVCPGSLISPCIKVVLGVFQFTNDEIREAVYTTLLVEQRQTMHGKVAEYLEGTIGTFLYPSHELIDMTNPHACRSQAARSAAPLREGRRRQ